MKLRFWNKQRKDEDTPLDESMESYNDYLRLVRFGEDNLFLDVDTSMLIEERDVLNDYILSGKFTEEQKREIYATDTIFKRRAALCAIEYRKRIEIGDKASDYLQMVLNTLDYPEQPKNKWWYHLVDDKS